MKKIFLLFAMILYFVSCTIMERKVTDVTIDSIEFEDRSQSQIRVNMQTGKAKVTYSTRETSDHDLFVVGDTLDFISKRKLREFRGGK